MSVSRRKLLSFLGASGLYDVAEREGLVTIRFSSLDLEEALGGVTEIVITGRVRGDRVEMERVVVVRNGSLEEVSPEVLQGWLCYIERFEA